MTATEATPLATAPMSICERGIYHHVTCHGCGNEAHFVRTSSPAPAYAMTFLSIAQMTNSLPRGLADAPGIADAVRLVQEALGSFLPDEPQPATEPPAAAPEPTSDVWVTVEELLEGRPLPTHPETGAPPCGVSFEVIAQDDGTHVEPAPVVYCAQHLLAELATVDPLPQIDFGRGRVLYRPPATCCYDVTG